MGLLDIIDDIGYRCVHKTFLLTYLLLILLSQQTICFFEIFGDGDMLWEDLLALMTFQILLNRIDARHFQNTVGFD